MSCVGFSLGGWEIPRSSLTATASILQGPIRLNFRSGCVYLREPRKQKLTATSSFPHLFFFFSIIFPIANTFKVVVANQHPSVSAMSAQTQKTAFVTGASSGIGKALAKELFFKGRIFLNEYYYILFIYLSNYGLIDNTLISNLHSIQLIINNRIFILQASRSLLALDALKTWPISRIWVFTH